MSPKPRLPPRPVRLVASHLSPRGEGVAPWEERAAHVPGLFAGEAAEVRLEHLSRHHPRVHGRVAELLEPHPARREPPCAQHASRDGRCTGCPLMALDEAAQREQKRGLLRAVGLEVAEVEAAPASLGYRASSKRVAFGRPGALRLGSYVRGSHRPADMAGCLVEAAPIRAAVDELVEAANALSIAPYDEKRAQGELRYAWLATDGEAVMLTLIAGRPEAEARIAELADALRVPATVATSVQAARSNAIRGEPATVRRGPATLGVDVAGAAVELAPLGFLQPNPGAIAAAYRALTDAPPGQLAWDLYAGAGLTTALLAERFEQVVSVDRDAATARPDAGAEGTAESTVESPGSRVLATAESFLESAEGAPDLVVLNPPRKGLGERVTAALLRRAPPRVHIMSCGPEGLARDLARLAEGYALRSLRAFDTLPQTPHVELVATLEAVREAPAAD